MLMTTSTDPTVCRILGPSEYYLYGVLLFSMTRLRTCTKFQDQQALWQDSCFVHYILDGDLHT